MKIRKSDRVKVAVKKGIPFELSIPSKELKKRAANLKNDKNTKVYETANELFEDLGI